MWTDWLSESNPESVPQPGTVYLPRYEPPNCRWAPSSACWRLSYSSTREPSSGAVVTEQRVRRRIQISGLNSTRLNQIWHFVETIVFLSGELPVLPVLIEVKLLRRCCVALYARVMMLLQGLLNCQDGSHTLPWTMNVVSDDILSLTWSRHRKLHHC